VRFEGLPPDEFTAFDAPGFARIVWALSTEPLGPAESLVGTETRVATTDAKARQRFRRYWAVVCPGVRLIRRQGLQLVRAEAEQRYRVEAQRRRVEPAQPDITALRP
jgi:hypothetical protein